MNQVPGGVRFYHDSGRQRFINATGRCNLNCHFCPEPADRSESGPEPSLRDLIDAACCTGPGYEIHFSGPGEPTFRLYDILRVGRFLRGKGVRVVLDTNGLASRIHNRPVAPDLEDNVDCLNVSLSAANARDYERICRPTISNAFDSVIEFIDNARDYVPELNLAVPAGQPEIDLAAMQELAKDLEVGICLRNNASLC
ncbi:MAG: radical SAM protein [Acidiferrobacterales bacterium]